MVLPIKGMSYLPSEGVEQNLTCKLMKNCMINKDGTISRRRGINDVEVANTVRKLHMHTSQGLVNMWIIPGTPKKIVGDYGLNMTVHPDYNKIQVVGSHVYLWNQDNVTEMSEKVEEYYEKSTHVVLTSDLELGETLELLVTIKDNIGNPVNHNVVSYTTAMVNVKEQDSTEADKSRRADVVMESVRAQLNTSFGGGINGELLKIEGVCKSLIAQGISIAPYKASYIVSTKALAAALKTAVTARGELLNALWLHSSMPKDEVYLLASRVENEMVIINREWTELSEELACMETSDVMYLETLKKRDLLQARADTLSTEHSNLMTQWTGMEPLNSAAYNSAWGTWGAVVTVYQGLLGAMLSFIQGDIGIATSNAVAYNEAVVHKATAAGMVGTIQPIEVIMTGVVKTKRVANTVIAWVHGVGKYWIEIVPWRAKIDKCIITNPIVSGTTTLPKYARVGTVLTVDPVPRESYQTIAKGEHYVIAKGVTNWRKGEVCEVVWKEYRSMDSQHWFKPETMPSVIHFIEKTKTWRDFQMYEPIPVHQSWEAPIINWRAPDNWRVQRAWRAREVGNLLSNPAQDWVGKKISDITEFQGRLCILCRDGLGMSRITNTNVFWIASVLQVLDTDAMSIILPESRSSGEIFWGGPVKGNFIVLAERQQWYISGQTIITRKNLQANFLSNLLLDKNCYVTKGIGAVFVGSKRGPGLDIVKIELNNESRRESIINRLVSPLMAGVIVAGAVDPLTEDVYLASKITPEWEGLWDKPNHPWPDWENPLKVNQQGKGVIWVGTRVSEGEAGDNYAFHIWDVIPTNADCVSLNIYGNTLSIGKGVKQDGWDTVSGTTQNKLLIDNLGVDLIDLTQIPAGDLTGYGVTHEVSRMSNLCMDLRSVPYSPAYYLPGSQGYDTEAWSDEQLTKAIVGEGFEVPIRKREFNGYLDSWSQEGEVYVPYGFDVWENNPVTYVPSEWPEGSFTYIVGEHYESEIHLHAPGRRSFDKTFRVEGILLGIDNAGEFSVEVNSRISKHNPYNQGKEHVKDGYNTGEQLGNVRSDFKRRKYIKQIIPILKQAWGLRVVIRLSGKWNSYLHTLEWRTPK